MVNAGYSDKDGKPFPLMGPLSSLGQGGVGVELFFRLQQWLFVLFGLSFVVSIAPLVNNIQTRSAEGVGPIATMTTGFRDTGEFDFGVALEVTLWQTLPWLIITVMFLCFTYFLSYEQRMVAQNVDYNFVTSADFAVEVRGFKSDVADHKQEEKDLAKFFGQFGPIAHLAVGYRCADYVKLLNQWRVLAREHEERVVDSQDALARGEVDASLEEIEGKMLDLETQMRALRSGGLESTGAVFLVYETEQGRGTCLKAMNQAWWKKLMVKLGLEKCVPGFAPVPVYKGEVLTVKPAPEPSDVIWENLEVEPHQVRLRTARTLAMITVLVLLTAALLVLVNNEKEVQVANIQSEFPTEPNRVFLYQQGVAVAAAGIITVLNLVIKYLVIWVTRFEMHDTRTDLEESVFIKLSIAYVINQSLILLVVSSAFSQGKDWFDRGGTFEEAFFVCLINVVAPEAGKVFRVDIWFNKYIMTRFADSAAKKNYYLTPPEAPIGEFHANLVKTVALALIYGPGSPIIFLLCAVTMLVSYAASKLALLRVFRPPPVIGEDLFMRFRVMMGPLVLVSLGVQAWIAGAYWVPLVLVGFIVWCVYVVVPNETFPCLRCVPAHAAAAPLEAPRCTWGAGEGCRAGAR